MDLASGAGDLLPPSPSVLSPMSRPFTNHLPNAAGTSTPTAIEHTYIHPSTPSIPPAGDAHTHAQTHTEPALKPPAIRPLDFMAFVASSAETHMELARTVDELSRWLAVVEGGLAGVLDKAAAGVEQIIQEEREGDERGRTPEGV